MTQHCDRCKEYTTITIMSMFNTDIICSKCKDEEKQHPMFDEAVAKENAAVIGGIMNFPGIGLPEDLEKKYNGPRVVVIHHLDGDGLCAAAAVDLAFRDTHMMVFMGINYPQEPKWELIRPADKVVIVDFSLQESQWPKLLELTLDVIWIDHHKTAMEKPSNPHDLPGSRVDGVAGAELTWRYFFPDIEPPRAVQLVSDYDIWKFEYGDETRFFQRAIYNRDKYPTCDMWRTLIKPDADDDPEAKELIKEMIKEGEIIHNYSARANKSVCRNYARYVMYKDYVCCVVNNQIANSMVFDSVDPDTYDVLSVFRYNGKHWSVSFYTPHDDIDVSKLAVALGGGGHRKAAGCEVDEIPFDFSQEDCKKVTPNDTQKLKRDVTPN